jgi:hypothetical protein
LQLKFATTPVPSEVFAVTAEVAALGIYES